MKPETKPQLYQQAENAQACNVLGAVVCSALIVSGEIALVYCIMTKYDQTIYIY